MKRAYLVMKAMSWDALTSATTNQAIRVEQGSPTGWMPIFHTKKAAKQWGAKESELRKIILTPNEKEAV